MNEQLARSLFMDYLYDEMESEVKQELESYLATQPELQEELQALQHTRLQLQQMPVKEPTQKLLIVEPKERSFSQWLQEAKNLFPQTVVGKAGLALAASLFLFFFIGSITRFNISFSDNGTSISFGYTPVVNEGLSRQEAQALIQQTQKEQVALLSDYIQTINQRNEAQLQQVVHYLEQQRAEDLQLMDKNLEQLQQNTNYRWNQTNRFLGEVLQTVNYNN